MQQPGPDGGARTIHYRAAGVVLLVAHLLFVGWYALRPLDVPWVSAPNTTPFATVRADLALGFPGAVRPLAAGLGLLAPLGVLLPLVGGRVEVSAFASLCRSTLAGGVLAMLLEIAQTGVPGQTVDIDSVLLALVGTATAHLLVVPALRRRARNRRGSPSGVRLRLHPEGENPEPSQGGPGGVSPGSTPRIPRVGTAP
ncbi:VanZ family protein [Streptomyces sp. SPB074]|uniref:VanZ family protein n=1 Tax=Streptomyces sp. (strain SPB074) TaxID=465543 RepID=UPI0001D1DF86|nr:VanZ family protein [Streptomyces sp. SPB074]EFG65237.1 integral membrane protein [Streptomyces sp. SPB074]